MLLDGGWGGETFFGERAVQASVEMDVCKRWVVGHGALFIVLKCRELFTRGGGSGWARGSQPALIDCGLAQARRHIRDVVQRCGTTII